MTADKAIAVFEQRRKSFLSDLNTLLRFETISTQPEHAGEMRRCADWLCRQLTQAGLSAEVLETGGHPAVFADSGPVTGRPDCPVLLCYGHYDVQPVGDPDLWTSPPFKPTIRDGAIYARGSADDKGQLMTHIAAIRCWHDAVGPLPIRMKFLLEGEEEIGSAHLPELVRDQRHRLACDDIIISDTAKHSCDTPALTCSTRGLVYKEITVEGPDHDLHSGQYGGAVANPANILAHIIASLHNDRQHVTIPGFYDDVAELDTHERQQLACHAMSDDDLLTATGSPAPFGEAGYTNTERFSIRPTLDVNGIIGGFTSKGAATIIPSRASAKVSMRLVPNQNPGKISAAFDAAIRQACPPAVRLSIVTEQPCAAYMAAAGSPAIQAARTALATEYGVDPVLVREGGTLPILPLFKEVLHADSVMMGFADPNCNLHSPNEFFRIRDFDLGTRSVLRFIEAMKK